jgi:hypothetical protein
VRIRRNSYAIFASDGRFIFCQKSKEQYLAFYDLQAQDWPIASEARMVETSYGQTFVRIDGEAGAQPLALLPGNGANSLCWASNIETLSAHYQTFAVDNIYDVGRSVYTRPPKSPDDFVSWLAGCRRTWSAGHFLPRRSQERKENQKILAPFAPLRFKLSLLASRTTLSDKLLVSCLLPWRWAIRST